MGQKTKKIIPVILSGGFGSRLWPLSRPTYPKQFLSLMETDSMLQATVRRIAEAKLFEPPIIVCNHEHRFIIAEQLRAIAATAADIILEPIARNTAPAVTAASIIAAERDPESVLLVLPSDHAISDVDGFRETLARALQAADSCSLVTFGIKPSVPETGYGYIRCGEALGDILDCYRVRSFVEKPDAAMAARLVSDGEHYWNSGMFLFRADHFLEEIALQAPEIAANTRAAVATAERNPDYLLLGDAAFSDNPAISIDNAVMEKTANAAVVMCDIGWSDVGSWAALWGAGDGDDGGNVSRGDVLMHDTENTLVHASRRLVTTLGLRDKVIIETADAVLVAERGRSQEVRQIVDALQRAGRAEAISHPRVYRPWGYYENIDAGPRYQVKQICVWPGGKLSLQVHFKRAEHWVVVAGTARVTRDKKILTLGENQSTFIPSGIEHRLENPGTEDLKIIEIQTGDYLGEDDIVRFEDEYGRVENDGI